ncbi:hypothetical protein SAMN04488498_1691 [Mesorhizobium albiziae]|uniref:Uncharacterized protein n=1 Tax=Neomesorhizobium albiziae TaxID=335020 RepID=A0A1I4G098_9HYPH|nr:hypothetical protein GCM10007937_40320 [Mesorhizobium albiziae]SFL23139.1 hypothetical protein SAMN04488498_1691 [Mesorhizobium albiziae]
MNRTIKEATVNRYHYDSHRQLEAHLADFEFFRIFGAGAGFMTWKHTCTLSAMTGSGVAPTALLELLA